MPLDRLLRSLTKNRAANKKNTIDKEATCYYFDWRNNGRLAIVWIWIYNDLRKHCIDHFPGLWIRNFCWWIYFISSSFEEANFEKGQYQ